MEKLNRFTDFYESILTEMKPHLDEFQMILLDIEKLHNIKSCDVSATLRPLMERQNAFKYFFMSYDMNVGRTVKEIIETIASQHDGVFLMQLLERINSKYNGKFVYGPIETVLSRFFINYDNYGEENYQDHVVRVNAIYDENLNPTPEQVRNYSAAGKLYIIKDEIYKEYTQSGYDHLNGRVLEVGYSDGMFLKQKGFYLDDTGLATPEANAIKDLVFNSFMETTEERMPQIVPPNFYSNAVRWYKRSVASVKPTQIEMSK